MKAFIIAIVVIFTGLIFIYFKTPQNTVAFFDIKKVQGQFIQQLALHKTPESEVMRLSLAFKKALQKTLTTYSQAHHLVILNSQYCLAGGIDITQDLAHEISLNMRAHR